MKPTILLICICLIPAWLAGQTHFGRSGKFSGRFPGSVSVNQVNNPDQTLKSAPVIRQREDSLISEIFDKPGNRFIPNYKYEFSYDPSGKWIKTLCHVWDKTSGKWSLHDKDEYSWDTSGDLVLGIKYNRDQASGNWIPAVKREFSYNDAGRILMEIKFDWNQPAGDWFRDYRMEYGYDQEGNLTSVKYDVWDPMTGRWIPDAKEEYAVTPDGTELSGTGSVWDKSAGLWVSSYRYEYDYDAGGNRSTALDYEWDQQTGRWVSVQKLEYSYDAFDNIISKIYSDYVPSSGTWAGYLQERYVYDNAFTRQDLLLPVNPGSEVNPLYAHEIISGSFYAFDENAQQWYLSERMKFFYSGQNITGVNDLRTDGILVHPNPASDFVVFDVNGGGVAVVEICDLQGKLVCQENISGGQPISVSELKRGFYLYRLKYQDKIRTGKIVLQ